jgi:hypothetical protein
MRNNLLILAAIVQEFFSFKVAQTHIQKRKKNKTHRSTRQRLNVLYYFIGEFLNLCASKNFITDDEMNKRNLH